jgi:hypothetical protein
MVNVADLAPEERKKLWEEFNTSHGINHGIEEKHEPKAKPIDKDFVSLGSFKNKDGVSIDYAFEWALWDNNVVISNLSKPTDSKGFYTPYEKITLTEKKLALIIPHMFKWFHLLREKKQ